MSTVNGLSGFSSMFDPYLSAGQTRFTVSRFEGSFASISGVTSGNVATDSSAQTSASTSSSASAPVTMTEVYAPMARTADGGMAAPVTVTEVTAPSAGSSQNQSNMLDGLIAAQNRAGQVTSADDGDSDTGDSLSAADISTPDATDQANDPYAMGALNTYSANSSDFSPSTGTGVSSWA